MKINLVDGQTLTLPSSSKAGASFLAEVVRSRGQIPGTDDTMSWDTFRRSILMSEDAITTGEIRPLLQTTLEELVRLPVEPMMIITGLYTRIQAQGLETRVLSGAVGAVHADDVLEHGTYPEVQFQTGGGMQVAYIGKSGIAASFTDEALRYSTWDIMAINLRLMGQALVRHKEQKAVSFLKTLGTTLYDNISPATSLFGVLTGRGLDMGANGSFTMDDLFRGMAQMAEEGFPPDVLLMNPLFFYLLIQDPVLRNMLMAHGGGSYFQQFTGNPGPRDPWNNGGMTGRGPSMGNKIIPGGAASGETATGIAGREHGMTAAPPIPSPYFPWPFRVVVSPLVPFDPVSQLGDIYLLSSGNVGYYLVDENPTEVSWRDEATEVMKVKIRERYGFAVAHEGQGVGVFRNVPLARNYWDGTVNATTMDVDAEIDKLAVLSL